MNYEKIYNALIQKRILNQITRNDCYCELHHIIPRSIRPDLTKEKTNIVALTAKEHFVAHHLLKCWYKEKYGIKHKFYIKMHDAYHCLARMGKHYISAKQFERIRTEHMLRSVGENNTRYGSRMLINEQTQEKYLCPKNEIEKYISNGWVIKSETKIFNNGKIQILACSCPDGFKPGMLKREHTQDELQQIHENRSNSQVGKRYMYDPITNITTTVKPDEIDQYLKNGYKFGRKLKRKTTKGYIWIYNKELNKKLRILPKDFDKYEELGYTYLPHEYWWNNGKTEIKSVKQPGNDYVRGRLSGLNTKISLHDSNIVVNEKTSSKRIPIIHKDTGEQKTVLECYLNIYEQYGYKRKFNKRKKKK